MSGISPSVAVNGPLIHPGQSPVPSGTRARGREESPANPGADRLSISAEARAALARDHRGLHAELLHLPQHPAIRLYRAEAARPDIPKTPEPVPGDGRLFEGEFSVEGEPEPRRESPPAPASTPRPRTVATQTVPGRDPIGAYLSGVEEEAPRHRVDVSA